MNSNGIADLLNALARLIDSFTKLMEATAPVGPAVFVFFPAIICCLFLRFGYGFLAAILAAAGWITLAAGSAVAGAALVFLAWIMPFLAAASRRRAVQMRELRDEIASLRDNRN